MLPIATKSHAIYIYVFFFCHKCIYSYFFDFYSYRSLNTVHIFDVSSFNSNISYFIWFWFWLRTIMIALMYIHLIEKIKLYPIQDRISPSLWYVCSTCRCLQFAVCVCDYLSKNGNWKRSKAKMITRNYTLHLM